MLQRVKPNDQLIKSHPQDRTSQYFNKVRYRMLANTEWNSYIAGIPEDEFVLPSVATRL